MRWILPLFFGLMLLACIESNPQPAPGTNNGNEDPANRQGGKDSLEGVPDEDGADTNKWGAESDAVDGAGDAIGAVDLDAVADATDLVDIADVPSLPDAMPDALQDILHDETSVPEEVVPEEVVEPEIIEPEVVAPDVVQSDVTHSPSQVRGGGSFFGMCFGACKQDLTIDGYAVNFVASNWDGTIFVDNDGTLTEAGLAKSQALAEALVGVDLDEVYGCPDCADGGGFYVMLLREGLESTHTYPFGQPFTALTACDTFIKELMTALAGCQSTEHIIVGNDCGPLG